MILDFHYMELLKHNLKGSYMRNGGIEVYNTNGRELCIFFSMDKRYVSTIFRYYGTYYFSEVGN